MNPYVTRILAQFDPHAELAGRTLDLDAVAVSMHCKMASCGARDGDMLAFAFNGYEDFNAFLFLLTRLRSLFPGQGLRLQFALRDYGAHYLAGDIELLEDQVRVFILDSAPSPSGARKWSDLIAVHFPEESTVYDHPYVLQMDRSSCKVFTLDAVNHLGKLSDLYTHLAAHATRSKKNLFHLAPNKLPPMLMRNAQSLGLLKGYLEANPEWAQLKINKRGETLEQSVARHTEKNEQDKPLNRAIVHKLHTFEDKARRFTEHARRSVLNQIVAERNGLLLLRYLEEREAPFVYPNPCEFELLEPDEGSCAIKIPLRVKLHQSASTDTEGYTTVFSVKHNSSNADKNALTWLDTGRYGVTLERLNDQKAPAILLSGTPGALVRMAKDERENIERDPIGMLTRGCSQPLGTVMFLGAMQQRLERLELSRAAQASFVRAYVDAMRERSPQEADADEVAEAGRTLAARHEPQLVWLTPRGREQLAREAALRSCQHALKRGAWTADVLLEGVTQARGGDVWNKKRERLQTHSSITEEWTADGVFKRSGTKAKYAGPSTSR